MAESGLWGRFRLERPHCWDKSGDPLVGPALRAAGTPLPGLIFAIDVPVSERVAPAILFLGLILEVWVQPSLGPGSSSRHNYAPGVDYDHPDATITASGVFVLPDSV